jgi:tRNA(adenine34) deaminase
MLSIHSDVHFMNQAILEASKAFEKGEIPVGAIIVCENQIIARAHNQTQLLNDVTAHAEMLAITAAADHLGNKYLHDCTLYVQCVQELLVGHNLGELSMGLMMIKMAL